MTDVTGQITGIALGACVGSFLNVVIWRLPRGTLAADGARSVCPSCRAPIPAYHNVPVISWLLLRGRAACCGNPIAWRYPLVEVLTALLFWALVVWPPRGVAAWPPGFAGTGTFLLLAWFVATLVACTFIDIDHQILPDRLTKPCMVIGVLGAFAVPQAYPPLGVRTLNAANDAILASVVGLLAGLGLTWSVRWLASMLFRKEAMGRGDIKFMGAIGAFLGWKGVLLTFFLGSLFGAVGGLLHRAFTGQAYVYFGPFLAAGALTTLFFGDRVLHFVLVTWPQWQVAHPFAPVVILGLGVIALASLFIIIRRGRMAQPHDS